MTTLKNRFLQLFGLTACLAGLSSQAHAAILTVTTTADSGPGSLRNLVRQANKTPEQDRILFDLPKSDRKDGVWTISLATPVQDITTPMRIVGPGSGKLTIEGLVTQFYPLPAAPSRPYDPSRLNAAVLGVTLKGGSLTNVQATLQLSDCVFQTGKTNGNNLFNMLGLVKADNCSFSGLQTPFSNFIGSDAVLSNCVFRDNTSTDAGGAINNRGRLTVQSCTFAGNTASRGGAIFNLPDPPDSTFPTGLYVSDSTFTNNVNPSDSIDGGGGGAIHSSDYDVVVQRSVFTGNTSVSSGGAIATLFGNVNVGRCLFQGNMASQGGAFDNYGADITVANSTVVNCTAQTGSAFNNHGGDDPLSLVNCTLFHNLVDGTSGEIAAFAGSVEVLNTLLRPAEGSAAFSATGTGTIKSLGHNLSSEGGSGLLTATGDLINTKPMLGNLADNGGPTLTMALLPGSPAIGAGDDVVLGSAYGLTTDQRGGGYPRKSGNHVDIGAFELQKAAAGAASPSGRSF